MFAQIYTTFRARVALEAALFANEKLSTMPDFRAMLRAVRRAEKLAETAQHLQQEREAQRAVGIIKRAVAVCSRRCPEALSLATAISGNLILE